MQTLISRCPKSVHLTRVERVDDGVEASMADIMPHLPVTEQKPPALRVVELIDIIVRIVN